MKNLLLCLALIFGITASAFACPCTGDDSPCKCPPGCECVINVGERVNDLPEDGGKWYITVFSDSPEHNKWFHEHTNLKYLKGKVHYTWIGSNSPMYKERYAKSTPKLPCVRLQDASGKVVYNAHSEALPKSPDALQVSLFDSIRAYRQNAAGLFNRNCPDGRCRPRPTPEPDPEPQPLDESEIPVITPDEVPIDEPVSELPPLWTFVVATLLGVLLGAGKYFSDWVGS